MSVFKSLQFEINVSTIKLKTTYFSVFLDINSKLTSV